MHNATHTITAPYHPITTPRRAPQPESKTTAMAGMTRDEVRRLVLSLIG